MRYANEEISLSGKVALITGGNTGIGKSIALEYARRGASVVIASLALPETEEVLKQIGSFGMPTLFVETDVTQFESVERLLHSAIPKFSRIDIVVNNAGVLGPLGPTELTVVQEWAETIRVNLIGTYHVCRAVIPLMRTQKGGKIINLAGGGATAPLPNFSAYAASKAAIVRFTEVLAHEVARSNVQVNAISPGVVMTQITKSILDHLEDLEEWERQYFTAEVAKGGNSPLLAAQMAVFLASEKSNHVSGKVLSAVWDDIEGLTEDVLVNNDALFTLRRIDNKQFFQDKAIPCLTINGGDNLTRWQRIAPDVKLGAGVKVFDFVNLYGCEIGDGSQIGPFVEIQRGVKIGTRVKVQSHAFICEGVTIEDEAFIGHGVMFVNDAYPRSVLQPTAPSFVAQRVLIKRRASIGSNATILGNLTIGENAIVGAGSVVTRDVPDNAIVAGNPARILRIIDQER